MNNRLLETDTIKLAEFFADLSQRVRKLEVSDRVVGGEMTLKRTSNQSIPNGVAVKTAIQWDTESSGAGFTWAIGSPTKIYSAAQRSGERFLIFGTANFATSGVGRRAIWLNSYTSAGVLIESIQLNGRLADGSDQDALPFIIPYQFTNTTDYFTIMVTQSSGGALNLTYAVLGAMVIR